MSDAATTAGHNPAERRGITRRSASRSLLGAVTVILGIVGLAMPAAQSMVPAYLDAIAGLVLGLVLIALGRGLSTAYARLLAQDAATADVGDQLATPTADMVIGAAVVILGVLAILSVASPVLIAVQVILVGNGLLLSAGAAVRLANIEAAAAGQRLVVQRVAGELAVATAGVRVAAGVAVLVLGILGVIGTASITLTLVAMIVAGAATLLDGNALGNRLLGDAALSCLQRLPAPEAGSTTPDRSTNTLERVRSSLLTRKPQGDHHRCPKPIRSRPGSTSARSKPACYRCSCR